MKTPKTFVTKKDFKDIEHILKEPEFNEKNLDYLSKSCETFLQRIERVTELTEMYIIGIETANKVEYTKEDLEQLVKIITKEKEEDYWLGPYLSALINKVITEKDGITIPEIDAVGIGMFLEKGTVIIKGNTNSYSTGYGLRGGNLIIEGNTGRSLGNSMTGGEIIIKGSAKEFTGSHMKNGLIEVWGDVDEYTGGHMIGGKIIIDGDAGNFIGRNMTGGKIIIKGRIGSIDINCQGTIYHGRNRML